MKENRIDEKINLNLVKGVLPEHFISDYPNLITFVETYYEYMDSDGQFGDIINDLNDIRDIGTTNLSYIDNMFEEFALGLGQDFFVEPREILRNFAKFFRVKGSLYSAKGFFRSFYNDDFTTLEYPKNNLFIVGDSASEIGPQSDKLIQDGGIYQVLSILIRSKISLGEYGEFYRRFVHPTGFHLAAVMEIDNIDTVNITSESAKIRLPNLDLEIEDSSNHKMTMDHDTLGCTGLVASGQTAILEARYDSANFDTHKIIYLDDGQPFEWGLSYNASHGFLYNYGLSGPHSFNPNLVKIEGVNNRPLNKIRSSIDSDYYDSSDYFRNSNVNTYSSLDSIDINTLYVQDFCFHMATPNAPYDSVGNTPNFPINRYRTIKEFCACENNNNDINSRYNIRPSPIINDINGLTIQQHKDALI
tara:strand:+ start:2204 stop:3454 length:1251 start_codon:yes stop_codon:yes gene_type:complete